MNSITFCLQNNINTSYYYKSESKQLNIGKKHEILIKTPFVRKQHKIYYEVNICLIYIQFILKLYFR